MKTITMLFLCSLICFAAATKPLFSDAVRSSASIDLDSQDTVLIQTNTNNKVKTLAYARQNVAAKAAAPQATATATASAPAASGTQAKPAASGAQTQTGKNVHGSSSKRSSGSSFISISITLLAIFLALF